ncbi:MAG: hypothetical protein DRQ02_00540 [Candidatus Latescibacterota bacterium]|nr:MAG: hypothetical protein DRQ02_00540 [Candidatus Latescibacterota bacterium]RKY71739.1 MAG: hypothetical protein DRQ24_06690 [Candidatus Latescibacterota bacterium]
MKKLKFFYEGAMAGLIGPEHGISEEELEQEAKRLSPYVSMMQQTAARASTRSAYIDERASINLPLDEEMRQKVKHLARDKRERGIECLVVIGIGGSNLGTIAVKDALLGKLYNQLPSCSPKILFADTVDNDYIADLLEVVEQILKRGGKVLLNVVTKSGSTTETVANFELFLEVLRRYYPKDYADYVVITTDKNSKLWDLAEGRFDRLEIPHQVGGRYSVFSPVGLFPLTMLGIDIDKLCEGAKIMRQMCLEEEIRRNPAALSALIQYIQETKKQKPINVNFFFSRELNSLGYWYRQLMGESIGKEQKLTGQRANLGITPVVAVGSVDLHSVAQLFLAGPNDKYTNFIKVAAQSRQSLRVPDSPEVDTLAENLAGKSFPEVMEAIFGGTVAAYLENRRPSTATVLPERSEYTVGQWLQWKMMEMIYLGALYEVNPFDQPKVEDYKKVTREILKAGRYGEQNPYQKREDNRC